MKKIHIANPHIKWLTQRNYGGGVWKRYLFGFGVVGTTWVLAYGSSVEDALEEAAEYCANQGWRGIVMPHTSSPEDLGLEPGDNPHECEDLTYTESGWLTAYEWTVTEPVTNKYLQELAKQ